MNLITQETQPSTQEYPRCERCGTAIAGAKPSHIRKRRFCSKKCANTRLVNNPDPTPEEIASGIRRIELTQNQYAIVDEIDYEWLNKSVWFAVWKQKTRSFVPMRNIRDGDMRRSQYMPRLIMGEPQGVMVDHKNHNGLDNRRSNLRLATATQNARNARKHCITSSRFKGVYSRKPWGAQITVNRKIIRLGYFNTEEEAAVAYKYAALKYHGEFACAAEMSDPNPEVVA